MAGAAERLSSINLRNFGLGQQDRQANQLNKLKLSEAENAASRRNILQQYAPAAMRGDKVAMGQVAGADINVAMRMKEFRATATTAQRAENKRQATVFGQLAAMVRNAPPDQRQALWTQGLQRSGENLGPNVMVKWSDQGGALVEAIAGKFLDLQGTRAKAAATASGTRLGAPPTYTIDGKPWREGTDGGPAVEVLPGVKTSDEKNAKTWRDTMGGSGADILTEQEYITGEDETSADITGGDEAPADDVLLGGAGGAPTARDIYMALPADIKAGIDMLPESKRMEAFSKYLLKSKGMSVTTHPNGTVTIDMGGRGAIEKPTRKKIEVNLLEAREGLARLEGIELGFEDEFQMIGPRFKDLVARWTSKLEGREAVDPKTREFVKRLSTHRQKTRAHLNRHIHAMTGAQVSKHEVPRLEGEVPISGKGLMDGDDPITFREKAKTAKELLMQAQARYLYYLEKGIRDVDQMAVKTPLDEVQIYRDEKTGALRGFVINKKWIEAND